MQEPKHFQGFVVFVSINKGTKSERLAPVFVNEGGATFKIYSKDDTSFESLSFRPYHKKYCKISGHLDVDRLQIEVTDIEVSEDPLEAILQQAGELKTDDNQTQEQNDE